MDVATWLHSLGLERYEQAFRENAIDFDVLSEITDADLEKLGVVLGHRKKLLRAIRALHKAVGSDDARAPPSSTETHGVASTLESRSERRHLTTMFVDLVGSTALSSRLDPEEMREVIRSYQNAVAGEIIRFEGHVAKFMGDGVLAYFGWPQAHEDEAERAVRAGLAIGHAVSKLITPAAENLVARVGIATGLVVVGDLIGEGAAQEQTVVGETPNLAARLQAIAKPGSVIVAESTRRLLGSLFELEELAPQTIRGFAGLVHAFQVKGEGSAESRFEALHAGILTPLFGREQELALLLERWSRAKEGDGQVVLLSGEPGIGKSRIVRTLRERLADEQYTMLSHYCSPYHTNSSLYPVIGLLERAAHFDREDAAETRLDKLENLLAQSTQQVEEVAPLLAALLGIPAESRYPSLDIIPQRQKHLTLEALVDQLAGLAKQRPVLAVYEDVHWIDPSTLELLELLVERAQRLPALLLITFRPEFIPPWTGHAHVTQLSLSRLTRRHGSAMALSVLGGKRLPSEVLEQIVARTDGVPLFVEELTKAVVESGMLRDAGDHFDLIGPLRSFTIPATLHDSLMARLDHLAPVKEVAQIASVIGRQFSHDLLASVTALDHSQLQHALQQLTEAELIFRRGNPPEATYTFKHALVQDAAYASLLKSRRQQLHARIGQILEERSEAGIETLPEVIAHHYSEAGLAEHAVNYWWQAAQVAIQRSATLEAIAHLDTGLKFFGSLPGSKENLRLELDMQVAMGTACMAAKGWSSPITAAAFTRADQLCEQVDDALQRGVADYGQYLVYLLRGQLDAALSTTTEMLRRAETRNDPTMAMIAHRCVAITSMHRGDFGAARAHLDAAMALYDPKEHSALAYRFAYEPRIAMLCYLAHALLHLGYPEQAFATYGKLLQDIRSHRHTPSVGFGLFQAALFLTYQHDLGAISDPTHLGADEAIIDELIAICTEHGFPLWRTSGLILKGWVMAQSGCADEGVAQIRDGIAAWRGHEAKLFAPRWLILLASALGRIGQQQAALETIDEALTLIAETNERWNEPELHLRKGELLLMQADMDRAEASFERALRIARDRNSRLWELRTAISMTRAWRSHGKHDPARDVLAPVYHWFAKGIEIPDLKHAKTLLDGGDDPSS
ncbi:MAG TPA: AAA family ATPase [Dongiaceae bacterium]|jgi:class 3 adenylate cyclase/predicted ATPase|nr:AAA family ATPase [Dongiaceae bacterium]